MAKNINFQDDLNEKLRDPKFASDYITAAIIENDLDFLPVALGDIAKAHGITKLSENSGINRRTLYKVFDKNGHPSFELVSQIMDHLGLKIEVKPKKSRRKNAI